MALTGSKPTLTQDMVMKLMETSIQKANELNIAISVAVIDDGGNLKGFLRMDDASLMCSKIAQGKAYTAVGFGVPTSEWYPRIKDEPELLHGLVQIDGMVILSGGLPIFHDTHLIGGIGVSGGTGKQDILFAQTALNALQGEL